MAINLFYLTFTEQDDIVPESGNAQILSSSNDSHTVNTLAGNDRITGSSIGNNYYDVLGYGFKNEGVLNTDDGDDAITGITSENPSIDFNYGFVNVGTLNAGEGNDVIFGSGYYVRTGYYNGIYNSGTLNAGEGDDIITGRAGSNGLYGGEYGIVNEGTLNTEDGNDVITGDGLYKGIINDGATVDMGEGNDTITASGISSRNGSTINTGNGEDSIISWGTFFNSGWAFLGQGNDSITITSADYDQDALINYNFIGTEDGDDIITIASSAIYNHGVIETGNGDDSIIVDEGFNGNGTRYGIYNNGGAINMGDGNDSIIANAGFESGENSSGAWFLGEGEDYIKGFGSGDFYGGNGNDTLELTPGTYTVGIWGEGGESPIFTKGNQLMITSQFETLIAGGIMYNFASLTAGQIITVPEV
jgi:hypothetical protein